MGVAKTYYRIWALVCSFGGRSKEEGDHTRLGAVRKQGHSVVGYLNKSLSIGKDWYEDKAIVGTNSSSHPF